MTPLHHSPEQLRWALKATGYTQKELASMVDISEGQMSEMLKGTRNVTPKNLRRIAQALNCPVGALEAKRDYQESA